MMQMSCVGCWDWYVEEEFRDSLLCTRCRAVYWESDPHNVRYITNQLPTEPKWQKDNNI